MSDDYFVDNFTSPPAVFRAKRTRRASACAICNSPRGEHDPRTSGCPVGTRADGGVLYGPTRFVNSTQQDGPEA